MQLPWHDVLLAIQHLWTIDNMQVLLRWDSKPRSVYQWADLDQFKIQTSSLFCLSFYLFLLPFPSFSLSLLFSLPLLKTSPFPTLLTLHHNCSSPHLFFVPITILRLPYFTCHSSLSTLLFFFFTVSCIPSRSHLHHACPFLFIHFSSSLFCLCCCYLLYLFQTSL